MTPKVLSLQLKRVHRRGQRPHEKHETLRSMSCVCLQREPPQIERKRYQRRDSRFVNYECFSRREKILRSNTATVQLIRTSL